MVSPITLPDIAVLINSCDKYSDLWRPFFHIFYRQWPDCPYPVFLGANQQAFDDPRVQTLCVGDDVSWATSTRRMLERMGRPYVVMLLDDFLLIRRVDSRAVERLVAIAQEEKLDCLRLRPFPPPSRPLSGYPGLGEIQRGEMYRVSTQAAIWKVETLHSLLNPDFDIWMMESTGSLLSDRMGLKIWSVYEPVLDYRHGVEKGRWLEGGLRICREAGVSINVDVRPIIREAALREERRKQEKNYKHILKRHLPRGLNRLIRLYRYHPELKKYLGKLS
jgi:hypothetical protein